MSDKLAGGIKAGSTDVSLMVLLRSTTDNTAVTGKTYTDFNVSYWRQGGTRTAVTEASLGTVDAAHSDGGIIEVDSTNMPGLYRLDLPDAAVATGADWVVISAVVSGAYVFVERYALESSNSATIAAAIAALNDLSAADVNAQCDTAISDAALATAAALATVDSNVDAILLDTGTTIPAQISGLNDLSAAQVNAEVDAALVDIHLDHLLAVDTGASLPGVTGSILQDLLEDDAGTWRYTVNALENGPTGSGASAETIADAVWDEAISGHTIAGTFGAKNQKVVPSETVGDYKADVSALATAANLATVDSNVDAILVDTGTTLPATLSTMEGKIDTVDTNVDAIKVKTDNLPSGITKNVALSNFQFLMVLSADHVSAATGKTVTGQISKDGGSFASLTNSVTEIGNGLYKVDLTQTEMNADVVTLKFTETDCDQRTLTIYTSA